MYVLSETEDLNLGEKCRLRLLGASGGEHQILEIAKVTKTISKRMDIQTRQILRFSEVAKKLWFALPRNYAMFWYDIEIGPRLERNRLGFSPTPHQ